MNYLTSIFLGIVQGITEFLPVSSSGHLVLIQKLIPGFTQPGILFDVILHFGTTAAVIFYFRKKILSLSFKYMLLLAVGTIPAVLIGLLFQDQLEAMFSKDRLLGFEFIISGILSFLVDGEVLKKSVLNIKNSFLIGIAQAFAIIPAISRSGATIFTGVKLGIDKKEVAEFSFLMSVPAILGANFLEIVTHKDALMESSIGIYSAGFITSLIVGFLSIGVLLRLLNKNKFKFFGYYCVILGFLVILFG